MNKIIFSQKIKSLRLNKSLSQTALAKEIGITKQALSNYESGKSEPNLYTLVKISDYFNCSIDSLVSEITNTNTINIDLNLILNEFESVKIDLENLTKKFNTLQSIIVEINKTSNSSEILTDTIPINLTKYTNMKHNKYKNEVAEEIFPNIEPKTYTPILYVGKVSAGSPAFAFESIIDNYNIDSSKLCNCKDYFILKVDGDSMNKLYLDGELILIERTNLVNNNDLVIALVDNDTALFKRILIDSFSLGLKPESSNPIHETKWYKKENIHILGKVIGALKDYID